MSLAGFFDIGDASSNARLGASSAKDPNGRDLHRSYSSPFLVLYFDCSLPLFFPTFVFLVS